MHVYVMAKICSSVEIQFWSWFAIRSSAEAVFHQYHLGCGEAASLCPGAEERQHGICLLFQRDFSCSMCPCRTILVGIVKTQTFEMYLFIRSSCRFANLGCINWECD